VHFLPVSATFAHSLSFSHEDSLKVDSHCHGGDVSTQYDNVSRPQCKGKATV
jgi:hypothetical protein